MRGSILVWGAVALGSLVIAGCGDDSATTSSGSGGAGGAATTGSSPQTTSGSPTSTGTGEGGDGTGAGPGQGGSGPGQGGSGPGQGGSGPGQGGSGPGQGGAGGEGGAAPVCGDGAIEGDEACEGDDLGDASCQSLGFYGGLLACDDGCALVVTGCIGEDEVCDDGADNDNDGLADCSDPACLLEDPSCTSDDEVGCTDYVDQDEDGLIDCADPSCQALPVCAPGDGAVGSACDVPSDCASETGADPLCLSPLIGFLGGSCSELCDPVADDCADGAVCFPSGDVALCLQSCGDAGDCRPGYDCLEDPDAGVGSVCVPADGSGAEVCDDGLDDDGDGLVDCADPSCSIDIVCDAVETACGDLTDNDDDGLTDCADPTECQGTPSCEPGDLAPGAPCLGSDECAAPGDAPLCIRASQWVGGYCASWCTDDGDCSPGSRCTLDVGVCLAICDSIWDCREGYLCSLESEGTCFPIGTELCDNARDDDGDELADCDDTDCVDTAACTAPEALCANLADDDGDDLFDCMDPSCAGSDDCVPGDGAVGEECTVATECAANGGDPICLTEELGFPGGHCSEGCDFIAQDCGADAYCIPSSSFSGLCFTTCAQPADCREGYACEPQEELGVDLCVPAAG